MYHYEQYTPIPISASTSTSNLHGVGSTRYGRYDRFQFTVPRIEANPKYVIDRNGTVYTFDDPLMEIVPLNKTSVYLDHQLYNIDDLLLRHYVGNLPFPVVPRDKPPESKIYIGRRCSKLSYLIRQVRPDQEDPNFLYINKVRFKRIPYAVDDIYISENGVAYNFTSGMFLMRGFSLGYAFLAFKLNRELVDQYFEKHVNSPLMLAHILYTTYVGPIPANMQVDHIDNVRYHDTVGNLQLMSPLENTRKSRVSGARDTGFTIEMNETIARMISEGKPNWDIAKELGFGYETRQEKHRIASIVNKIRYQKGYFDDFKEKYDLAHAPNVNRYPYKRLTPEERVEIKRESKTMTGRELAKKYGVTPAAISRVINDDTIMID